MTAGARLRAGRPDEAGELNALALRSKAHWGYPDSALAAGRTQLEVTADEMGQRRVTVAEQDGRLLGFATLEGSGPHGRLGLLFVEPSAIGRGHGTRLYRHVLEEAARLGFERVLIDADPHAEGFYRRMGAQRGGASSEPGLVPMMAFPRRPEPGWVAAWTGGRDGGRAVHLGNVAEFHRQFDAVAAPVRAEADHYACMAVFAGPRPAMVVLPQRVGHWWVRGLAERLAWGQVEVHAVEPGPGGLCEAVSAREALLERIRASGLPVLAWGRTAQAEQIMAGVGPGPGPGPGAGGGAGGRALRVARAYESKATAHALFLRLAADGHPDVVVPAQRRFGSGRELVRALSARASAGLISVVKAEHGVGGSTTWILTPRQLRRPGAARRMVRGLPPQARLLEDHVANSGPFRAPTFDAVVADDGSVHPVGVGAMEIVGTGYQGVTVGPGAVPDGLAQPVTAFGAAVGRALAAEGYRGWYDVDFVAGPDGRVAPTEINLRLTGPAVAFTVQARMDRLHGGRHLVRTLDCVPLGARLPEAALRTHLDRLEQTCEDLGVTLLPTIPTAAGNDRPYLGVALAARSGDALDAAEALLVRSSSALADAFSG
ncbi:GNAT family N-acetyltransferase [Streptomyces naganishii]|uniref:N-acetyltransferase domain-containing protein n=1 Tax=Streptomyces naganishii JCM 4654 TaxID=1306179 RepID=A0A918Y206_9ACTN|nr:GNAT family N-acetyltransferase [Streptomyces naganishii]GHD86871.1 hypothetical protein GCM10010508_16400 [Streptomyces naganishii JCM 4654]